MYRLRFSSVFFVVAKIRITLPAFIAKIGGSCNFRCFNRKKEQNILRQKYIKAKIACMAMILQAAPLCLPHHINECYCRLNRSMIPLLDDTRLSLISAAGTTQPQEGFTDGSALPDDFKLWLSRHPGLTIEEALHRYREEQKAKRRRQGTKL